MVAKVCDAIMGSGKAQPMDALLLGKDGYYKMGDTRVGMEVFGEDGALHKITGIYPQGVKKVYRVTFSDRTSTVCCGEHLWTYHRGGVCRTEKLEDMMRVPLYQKTKRGGRKWQVSIPLTRPVQFRKREPGIDLYTLSRLMGGDNPCGVQICDKSDEFIHEYMKFSDINDRVCVLAVLLETCGSVHAGHIDFTSTSERMIDDITFIVQSLGGTAAKSSKLVRGECGEEKRYTVCAVLPPDIACMVSGQKSCSNMTPRRTIRKIEYVGEEACQCIMVDNPSHLYLTNDCIVTHNTESAITLMNQDWGSRYVFITPYLNEVERIKKSCAKRGFKDPQPNESGKLEDLHRLLARRENIASTHALFRTYNSETISLIKNGGYKLILDEVFQAVETIPMSSKDLKMLRQEMIEIDPDYRVRWVKDDYEGRFEDFRDTCMTGNVILYHDCLLLWKFPIDVFLAFDEVIILTYMFDAQVQKYYFDVHNIEAQHIGAVCENGVYHFSDTSHIPPYVKNLPNQIHIVDDKKLNKIGDDKWSLSATWYSRAEAAKGKPQIVQLKNNLANLYRNKFCSASTRNLWTVFNDYQNLLKGKGYTKGFLVWNARATNAYRNRDCLAYCVNVYYNPLLKSYFQEQGVDVQEDKYALSEMVQWIWRSAIRDGKEIWVYIPSKRMRELLQNWMSNLALMTTE